MRDLSKILRAKTKNEKIINQNITVKRLKIKQGDTYIKILPYKFDNNLPFLETYLHFGWEKYPVVSPKTWDNEGEYPDSKTNYSIKKKLTPVLQYSFWVMDPKKRKKEPLLWSCSPRTFQDIINILVEDPTILDEEGSYIKINKDTYNEQGYQIITISKEIETHIIKGYDEAINNQLRWEDVYILDEELYEKHLDRIINY